MQQLDAALIESGLAEDMNGWELTQVHGVSDDGLVFVGGGCNPEGAYEAWRAVIPEPGSLLVMGLSVAMCLVGRWKTFGR